MIFDDGKHRVELRYFGVGHTHGDGFAWLPKERILFTGDAAVNGPYNYMGDGDSARMDRDAGEGPEARRHNRRPRPRPVGDGGVLEAQRQYFVALRAEVEKRRACRRTACRPRFQLFATRCSGGMRPTSTPIPGSSGFESQAAQVYREMTGGTFPKAAAQQARRAHEHHHEIQRDTARSARYCGACRRQSPWATLVTSGRCPARATRFRLHPLSGHPPIARSPG